MSAAKVSLNSITVTHRDLKDLLTPVLPHVDGSGRVPVLGCVSLQTRGGYLTATATDRYTIAVTRLAVEPGTEFTALVQAVELKALLAMFKPSRYTIGQSLTLTIEDDDLRVEGAGALFSSAVIKYSVYKGEYPKCDALFTAKATKDTGESFNLNGNLLAKFRCAAHAGEPLEFTNAGGKTFVKSGDHFTGIIMQARKQADDKQPETGWESIFTSPKSSPEVAA